MSTSLDARKTEREASIAFVCRLGGMDPPHAFHWFDRRPRLVNVGDDGEHVDDVLRGKTRDSCGAHVLDVARDPRSEWCCDPASLPLKALRPRRVVGTDDDRIESHGTSPAAPRARARVPDDFKGHSPTLGWATGSILDRYLGDARADACGAAFWDARSRQVRLLRGCARWVETGRRAAIRHFVIGESGVCAFISASGSLMSSPLPSTVTVWSVPVNWNGPT
jgi:hypothetical protein